MKGPHRLRDESGFTLIECLVAAVVLAVGLLGTFTMLDGASAGQSASRSREAAVNLARDVIETVRGDAYASVDSSLLTTTLQATSGFQSISGSTATIRRRNIDFQVTASVCKIDDPKDGLGTTDATFCSASTPTSPPDTQPDDLKRVTVSVTWSGARSTTIRQAAMLNSTGAVIGLSLSSFTMDSPGNTGASPTSPIITTSSTAAPPCPAGTACFTANAAGASRIIFAVDGIDQSGAAVTMDSTCAGQPCPKWHFAWSYGSLSDGVYRITARSVDINNIEGPPKSIFVTIAKGTMSQPTAVDYGYNYLPNGGTSPIFELRWQANPERNVVGYEVKNGSGTVVCTLDAQGSVTSPAAQTPTPGNAPNIDKYACIDTNPPPLTSTPASYSVYARYATPSGVVNGPAKTVSQAGGNPASMSYTTVTRKFGLDSRNPPAPGCFDSLTDMTAGVPGAWVPGPTEVSLGTGSNAGPTTNIFCSPALNTVNGLSPANTLDITGVTLDMTGGDSSTQSTRMCTLSWNLTHNAANVFPVGTTLASLVLKGGSPTYQELLDTPSIATPINIGTNDVLKLALTLSQPGGFYCGNAYLRYGGNSAGQPSPVVPAPGWLTVTFRVGTTIPATTFATPGAPTGAGHTQPSPPDMNINWTGPAPGAPGNNVAFYRIYRDGQDYQHRYDTCDVGDTGTGGCDHGNNTFTYTDQNTGGTAHTYWITAVYGTTTSSTMAESAEVPVP